MWKTTGFTSGTPASQTTDMDPAAEHLAPLLGRLTNYERNRPARQGWSLANMHALLARLYQELV